MFLFVEQESWGSYGIDVEGPVPLDDESTIVVDELPNVLSEEERAMLRRHIVQPDSLSAEWMIENYSVTRYVVHLLSQ